MKEEDRKRIQEIIGGMQCPKDFLCAQRGFEGLCKARDIGLKNSLVCLEENQVTSCGFLLLLGRDRFCQCPLRVYLKKNLKK